MNNYTKKPTAHSSKKVAKLQIMELMREHNIGVVMLAHVGFPFCYDKADLISDPTTWQKYDLEAIFNDLKANGRTSKTFDEFFESFMNSRSPKTLAERTCELSREVLEDLAGDHV